MYRQVCGRIGVPLVVAFSLLVAQGAPAGQRWS